MPRSYTAYLMHGMRRRLLVALALLALLLFVVLALRPRSTPHRECCLCPGAARIVFHPNPGDVIENVQHVMVVGREFSKTMARDPGPHIFMIIPPGAQLTDHQVCSVESAALHHPDYNVHVLLLDDTSRKHSYRDMARIRHLSRIKNVRLWHMERADIFSGSPLQRWHYQAIRNGSISRYPKLITDAVKVVLLWTFGGTILDPDFIVQRSLDLDESSGAIVEDSTEFPTTHFFSFPKNSSVLRAWIKGFEENYGAHHGDDAGSIILMHSIRSACNVSALDEVAVKSCKVKVMRSKYFFPVHQKEVRDMFQSDRDMTSIVRNSKAVWLWSDDVGISHMMPKTNSFYVRLMKSNCPLIQFSKGTYVYKGERHIAMSLTKMKIDS